MSELPKGWLAITLGQVTSKPQYGYTTKSQTSGDVLYLRTTDLTSGKVDWDTVPYCVDAPKDVTKYQLDDRDIVISRAGSVGFHLLVKSPPLNAVFASYLIRFKPSSFIDERYLSHFFNSKAYWSQITEKSAGVAVQNVNAKKLTDLNVPLAPLNEQIRIANKLDSILAKVAQAQARLEKVPIILKRFRQSVLAAATSGELTREWREDERLIEVNDKYVVPNSWSLTSLGKLATLVTSGSRGWAKYYSEGGSLFIRAQNINSDHLNLNDVAFVSLPDKAEGRRTIVEQNNLLVTITGANVTKSARVKGDIGEAYVSQHVALIKLVNEDIAPFIELVLQDESSGRGQLLKVAYGGGKPGLNLTNIKEVKVALPTSDEQAEIVSRVDTLFSKADRFESQYEVAKTRLNRLSQSILSKAYRGELVSQDPTDESARILLERIKVELGADKKKNTVRKPKKVKDNEANAAQQTSPELFGQLEKSSSVVNAAEAKDSLRIQYQEQIEKAQSALGEAKFTVEQFRSVTDFKGDYDSLKALVMNLLKGIPGLSEPLLEVDDWDVKNGDYLLRLLEAK